MIVPDRQKSVSAAAVGLIEELARLRSQVERLRGALEALLGELEVGGGAIAYARRALAETGKK